MTDVASAKARLEALNTELAIVASEVQAIGHPDDESSQPTQAAFSMLAEASASIINAIEWLNAPEADDADNNPNTGFGRPLPEIVEPSSVRPTSRRGA